LEEEAVSGVISHSPQRGLQAEMFKSVKLENRPRDITKRAGAVTMLWLRIRAVLGENTYVMVDVLRGFAQYESMSASFQMLSTSSQRRQ
jgi:hypothetical protein